MKKITVLLSCMALFFVLASNANALLVTFDDASSGEILDTKYAPALTLASILNSPNTLTALPTDTGANVDATSAGATIATSTDHNLGILLTFGNLMSSVSIVGFDWGGHEVDDNETMYLSAFDAGGALLGSDSFAGPWANPNTRFGTLTFDNMKYVAFTFGNTTLSFYGIDSIEATEMNSVPEPATMLLFGTCLAGLAGMRIRGKRK